MALAKPGHATKTAFDACRATGRPHMHLVVFSPPAPVQAEAELLNAMFEHGLARYHLRRPGMTWDQVRPVLDALKPEHRLKTMVHQHHSEATQDYGIMGLHYPERLRPSPPLAAVPGMLQSTSLHKLADLQTDWGHLHYAFLSPIFDSISKQGYQAASFDRDQLKALLAGCPMDIIALGGMTPDRVAEARELGFKGVAVIGSVWGAADPVEAFIELQEACK